MRQYGTGQNYEQDKWSHIDFENIA
jgi:hypothetical protein